MARKSLVRRGAEPFRFDSNGDGGSIPKRAFLRNRGEMIPILKCCCGAQLSSWRGLFLHWVKGRKRGWPCFGPDGDCDAPT